MDALKQAAAEAKQRPIVVPEDQFYRRDHPIGDALVGFVGEAREWCQPMQDDLIPILMANGFRTKAEQDESMKRALLRAAALDPFLDGRERTRYANRYGRPSAIRIVWWLRRTFGREEWDG